jgi:amino acid adenylation domain-containing protein
VLELPADRTRPRTTLHGTDFIEVDFDPALVRDLRTFADERGASLFVVLTAALNVVLARYSGQHDIPVGVTMLGRTDPDLEYVLGIFVNMVVLRSDLSGDPTFGELSDRVGDAVLDLFDHQDTPFEKVVERVAPIREPGRNPLFQVAVQVLTSANSGGGLELGELGVEGLGIGLISAMFDLNLNFFETDDGLRANLAFATELFDRWRIENLLGHLEQVLRAGIADPGLALSQLPLMSAAERDRVLRAGQGESHVDPEEPVHVTVAAVAAAQPDTTAAVCKGVELSYRDLDHRAEQLARHINNLGVGHEQIVAIAMDRDLDTLIAMLAVWKAGAAFTMLDPRHPAARLEFMLRDTSAPLLITRATFAPALPVGEWRTLLLDQEQTTIDAIPVTDPLPAVSTRDSLAYVLYTSGSTGHPKGVLIEHRALRCFTEAYRRTFDFGPGDRLLQLPALTFDMSEGEIWTALTYGATLVQVSPAEGESPEALAALMRDQRVTYAGLTPPMLSLVEAGPYPDLKYVMGGADALPAELVNKWNLPGRRFVNLYGPTEAAVACTEYECEHTTWQSSPPIGWPEYNRLLYVVDPNGHLVPQGVPGELLIGGDEGLARGYLNQPELTAEKFVPDPFRAHGLVYRSGDLVRWTENWQIDFLGRIDNQIKLRGLRIELGEIESALLAHPGVRMAVVLAHTDPRGDKQLVGYYTPRENTPAEPVELRAYLATVLPEYMVPTAWVRMAEFPLTGARKVDRRALPAPDFGADGTDRPIVAPSTPMEQAVAEIFAHVLSADRVGADTNFFEVGGNSLQAMRAVSRINKAFGIRVNVRLLYGSKSVSAIAAAIDELVAKKVDGR